MTPANENADVVLLEVAPGKVFPGTSWPRPPGIQWNATNSEITLMLMHPNPTPREIRGARTGRLRLGLMPYGQHTTFLLVHMELALTGWADAPFALGIVPEQCRGLPERAPTQGLLISFIYGDSMTGMVHATRATSLSPTFCACLEACVAVQQENLAEFTLAAHDRELAQAYATYRNAEDMLSRAVVVETAGMPFEKAAA